MALRLIALFKLLKGLLLAAVGLAALRLLHADVAALVTVWADRLNIDPQNRYLGDVIGRLTFVDARALILVATGSFAYAALLLTEGIGLWLKRRWAEYFTIVVTVSFIPLELYELARRWTLIRLAAFGLNVLIVWYLVRQLRMTPPDSAELGAAGSRRAGS
ncbi:MAG TPA: DUF2127 domain-containing protein [Methylomirabilota bacterium]|jgi:uncharacterized membrane protein (DUF2068 family)